MDRAANGGFLRVNSSSSCPTKPIRRAKKPSPRWSPKNPAIWSARPAPLPAIVERLNRLADLAGVTAPMLATNDVYVHKPGRRILQDAVTCLRALDNLEAGHRLEGRCRTPHQDPEEMVRLFRESRRSGRRSASASRICFSLEDLKYNYTTRPSATANTQKRRAPDLGGHADPNGIPEAILKTLSSGLCLIPTNCTMSHGARCRTLALDLEIPLQGRD